MNGTSKQYHPLFILRNLQMISYLTKKRRGGREIRGLKARPVIVHNLYLSNKPEERGVFFSAHPVPYGWAEERQNLCLNSVINTAKYYNCLIQAAGSHSLCDCQNTINWLHSNMLQNSYGSGQNVIIEQQSEKLCLTLSIIPFSHVLKLLVKIHFKCYNQ